MLDGIHQALGFRMLRVEAKCLGAKPVSLAELLQAQVPLGPGQQLSGAGTLVCPPPDSSRRRRIEESFGSSRCADSSVSVASTKRRSAISRSASRRRVSTRGRTDRRECAARPDPVTGALPRSSGSSSRMRRTIACASSSCPASIARAPATSCHPPPAAVNRPESDQNELQVIQRLVSQLAVTGQGAMNNLVQRLRAVGAIVRIRGGSTRVILYIRLALSFASNGYLPVRTS